MNKIIILYYSLKKKFIQLFNNVKAFYIRWIVGFIIIASLFSLVLSRYYYKTSYSLLHEVHSKTELLQQEKEDLLLEKTHFFR